MSEYPSGFGLFLLIIGGTLVAIAPFAARQQIRLAARRRQELKQLGFEKTRFETLLSVFDANRFTLIRSRWTAWVQSGLHGTYAGYPMTLFSHTGFAPGRAQHAVAVHVAMPGRNIRWL